MFSVRKIMPGTRCRVFFILLTAVLLQTCSRPAPITETEKKAFEKTYAELMLAYIKFHKVPQRHAKIIDIIFKQNHTNREFLDSTAAKIASHIKLQEEIYTEIEKRLAAYEKLPPDSINEIWADSANSEK